MTTVRVAAGDVLRGKYRIKRVLGQGGVGIVVRATHLRLEQDVAIKMLRDQNAPPHVVERFAREARAAARLRSEHVVRILDVDDEGGSPFLVMEYLEGRDLERVVRKDGPRSTREAAGLLLQACEGLAEAHSLGIVHRDIKPANLFLAHTARGVESLKLLDFGISKVTEDPGPLITETERILGSPAFMSPEQLRAAHDVDARTDVWALGVVAYFLVSGKLPFEGNTATEVAARIAADAPPPLDALAPDVPAAFAATVARCLSKDRNGRFETVAALAHALAPFAADGEAHARRVSSVLRIPLSSGRLPSDHDLPSTPSSKRTGPETLSLPDVGARGDMTRSFEGPAPLAPPVVTASVDAPGPVSLGNSERPPPSRVPAAPAKSMRSWLAVFGVVLVGGGVALALRGRSSDDTKTPASAMPAPGGRCQGTIKVRVLYDQTGATREVGVDAGKGVLDHLRAIDADGGIRGCRIELESADTNYNAEATLAAYRAWQSSPAWTTVSTVFGQGTPMVQALGPLTAQDGKVLVSSAFTGELASPIAVTRDLGVPSLSGSFVEATVPVQKRSHGYPTVFFQGTDYTTAARVAMSFAWKRGAKRVGFFGCSTSTFCTDPFDGAKTFLPVLGGTKAGRDLAIELDEDEASIEKKVDAYFRAELAQAARDPSYEPVDWIWFGNTRASLARLGRALERVRARMPLALWIVTNNWGLDETLYRECGDACVGFYGVQPFPAFGDGSAPGMKRLLDIHRAQRIATGEPPTAHATIQYVYGYVAVAAWRAAVESALDAGQPITGASIRAAFERFRQRSLDGFATLTYSPSDHRPQATARVYTMGKTGRLEPVGQPLAIALQNDWLGW